MQLIWVFGLAFIPCELGERVRLEFNEIGCTIDRLDWYIYPAQIWPLLPIIIMIGQQPVTVNCFGSISCCREVFKSVSSSKSIKTFSSNKSKNSKILSDNQAGIHVFHAIAGTEKMRFFD